MDETCRLRRGEGYGGCEDDMAEKKETKAEPMNIDVYKRQDYYNVSTDYILGRTDEK